MKEFWDARYAETEYSYGEEPNEFFSTQLAHLAPGRILMPAEGEGRNAVHAARQGWEVDAFDFSREGRRKALNLADRYEVRKLLNYTVIDLAQASFDEGAYDAVGLVFAHFPADLRQRVHAACAAALRPGGVLMLEAFTPRQVGKPSGGPQQADLLYTKELLEHDFGGLNIRLLEERDVELTEGQFHRGPASVVRLVAER